VAVKMTRLLAEGAAVGTAECAMVGEPGATGMLEGEAEGAVVITVTGAVEGASETNTDPVMGAFPQTSAERCEEIITSCALETSKLRVSRLR
jgi:hypothetical protein